MMRTLAFVDLDDTLFSSLRKLHGRDEALQPAALLRDGTVISYSNRAQRALLRMLRTADQIIPVTARNIDAFQRVLIDFNGPAIVSHGATVLRADGKIDMEWLSLVGPRLQAAETDLRRLLAHLQECTGAHSGLQPRLVFDGDQPVYLVVKHQPGDAQAVAELAAVVSAWVGERDDYTLHLNGNNLAVIPPSVGKAAAVEFLLSRERAAHGEVFSVGAGDSLTDLEFLRCCDVSLIPSGSQIDGALSGTTQSDLPPVGATVPTLQTAREN